MLQNCTSASSTQNCDRLKRFVSYGHFPFSGFFLRSEESPERATFAGSVAGVDANVTDMFPMMESGMQMYAKDEEHGRRRQQYVPSSGTRRCELLCRQDLRAVCARASRNVDIGSCTFPAVRIPGSPWSCLCPLLSPIVIVEKLVVCSKPRCGACR